MMQTIELLGVFFSIAGVWLTVRNRFVCWIANSLACVLYCVLFFEQRLYADSGLQIVFIVMNLYGLYSWHYGGESRAELRVSRASTQSLVTAFMIGIVLAVFLGVFLRIYTNAALPYLDSLLTGLSLVATWLAARRYIENWIVWLGTDTVYVGMFLYRQLWFTAFLYAVFIGLAARGYIEWKKRLEPPLLSAS